MKKLLLLPLLAVGVLAADASAQCPVSLRDGPVRRAVRGVLAPAPAVTIKATYSQSYSYKATVAAPVPAVVVRVAPAAVVPMAAPKVESVVVMGAAGDRLKARAQAEIDKVTREMEKDRLAGKAIDPDKLAKLIQLFEFILKLIAIFG